jgi:hypothetical protein
VECNTTKNIRLATDVASLFVKKVKKITKFFYYSKMVSLFQRTILTHRKEKEVS